MQVRVTRSHLSTELLPLNDQRNCWGDWVSQLHGNFSVHRSMPRSYTGQIMATRCDGLQIVKFSGQRESLERKRSHVAADGLSHFEIVVPLSDSLTIVHGAKPVNLSPGQFMAVDMSEPTTFEHCRNLTAIAFAFPREEISRRLAVPETICGRPLVHHSLLAALLAFISAFADSADAMDDHSFAVGARHIRDLAALVLLDNVDNYVCESAARVATLTRIKKTDQRAIGGSWARPDGHSFRGWHLGALRTAVVSGDRNNRTAVHS
ncbi:hypothetical protein ACVWXP_007628 [Bradyrhizobium sp. USDA 4463]